MGRLLIMFGKNLWLIVLRKWVQTFQRPRGLVGMQKGVGPSFSEIL
jgi:hypothetical protein